VAGILPDSPTNKAVDFNELARRETQCLIKQRTTFS